MYVWIIRANKNNLTVCWYGRQNVEIFMFMYPKSDMELILENKRIYRVRSNKGGKDCECTIVKLREISGSIDYSTNKSNVVIPVRLYMPEDLIELSI